MGQRKPWHPPSLFCIVDIPLFHNRRPFLVAGHERGTAAKCVHSFILFRAGLSTSEGVRKSIEIDILSLCIAGGAGGLVGNADGNRLELALAFLEFP